MSDAELVADFTRQTGYDVPDKPIPMKEPAVNFLIKMILDEVLELAATVYEPTEAKQIMTQMLIDAKEVPKVVSDDPIVIAAEQVDACIDNYIYCLNACAKHGMNLSKIFTIVHNANLSKRDPVTGEYIRNKDGKVLKPTGWVAPDVNSEIARQIKEGAWSNNVLRISEPGEWFNFEEKEGTGYVEDRQLKEVKDEIQAMKEEISKNKYTISHENRKNKIQAMQTEYENKLQLLKDKFENDQEEYIKNIVQEVKDKYNEYVDKSIEDIVQSFPIEYTDKLDIYINEISNAKHWFEDEIFKLSLECETAAAIMHECENKIQMHE